LEENMKTAAWIAILLTAAGLPAPARNVTVCSDAVPGTAFDIARSTVIEIFARIGVTLQWSGSQHCISGALRITMSTREPSGMNPGVLGYASPLGNDIVVLWDRVQARVATDEVPHLLAHVLAHEITHVLQGYARHSAQGLMKARWDMGDFHDMRARPLPFTSEDIRLIYAGLDRRISGD
jgi:hypothetical protein